MSKITDVGAALDPQFERVESRVEQLERELVEVKEQLRLCNVDQFTTAAELAEAIAKERERCARVCDEITNSMYWLNDRSEIAQACADAIRNGE